jgi:hypothetical protein
METYCVCLKSAYSDLGANNKQQQCYLFKGHVLATELPLPWACHADAMPVIIRDTDLAAHLLYDTPSPTIDSGHGQ